MINPLEIVEIARTLINTPYKHQGRTGGKELDCIGLIIEVAKIANLIKPDFNYTNYTRQVSGELETQLDVFCPQIKRIQPGAIALFKVKGEPRHCGILSYYLGRTGLIHAYESVGFGRVTEHTLPKQWQNNIVKLYGFPGVDYA